MESNGTGGAARSRPRLVAVAGPLAGRVIDLDGELTIGRAKGNLLVLDDRSVSREHCLVRVEGDGLLVVDLGSRHGTYLNGARIDGARRFEAGDRLAIGRSMFQLNVIIRDADSTESFHLSDDQTRSESVTRLRVDDGRFLRPDQLLPTLDGGRTSADLDTLRRISVAIQSLTDWEALADRLLELLFDVIPAERGGILLRAPSALDPVELSRQAVRLRAAGDGPIRLSRTIVAEVIHKRTGVLLSGQKDVAAWPESKSLAAGRVRSVLCVPIALFERTVGVLYLDSSATQAPFDHDHLELAAAVAGLAAMPLDAALHAQATEPSEPAAAVDDAADLAVAGVVLRVDSPLHLATVLTLLQAVELLPAATHRRLLLLHDFGSGSSEPLAPSWLDRLALWPLDDCIIARSSAVPSIAGLATLVAATLPSKAPVDDSRAWFQEILLAAGLVVTRAAHAMVEPAVLGQQFDNAADLELARRLASRVNAVAAGTCSRPAPLLRGFTPLLSLDGKGPMGTSPKGTVFVADSEEQTAKKIRAAKTDARATFDPDEELTPEVANLLLLLHAVTGEPSTRALQRLAGKGYGDIKSELADAVNTFLRPIRERRRELETHPELAARLQRDSLRLEVTGRAIATALSQAPRGAG